MKENISKLTGLKRLWFILLLSLVGVFSAFAQERTITGNVKDDTGQPAIGATVKVPGTTIGTMTDFDGNYTLQVPEDAKELEFSYVGLETKTAPISGSRVDMALGEAAKELEEIVVTGYGQTKKRDVVTSVASVGADQIKNIPVTSAAEAMQGKLAGVTVATADGSPDADLSIRVRAGGSLTQSNDPLYIVDGFPVSSISDIAPSDIKSMDVLKDAAATAIYGAQGANGVIIITTKDSEVDEKAGGDGCKSKISVDYTGYMGWKKITKTMDLLSARDFALLQYENQYHKNKSNSNLKSKFYNYFDYKYVEAGSPDYNFTPMTQTDEYGREIGLLQTVSQQPYTDWQDETFGRTGTQSNHSFTVKGGNKGANFTASYNRIDDKAIMEESNYERNNLSLKANFKPMKGLRLGFTTRYSNTEVLGAGSNTAGDAGSSTQSRMRNAIQYTPIKLASSQNAAEIDEERVGSMYDPIVTTRDNYKYKEDNKFNIQGFAEYKFLEDWTVRSELGYESRNVQTDRFYGPTTYYAMNTGRPGVEIGSSSMIYTEDITSKLRNANTINWDHRFKGSHHVSVLLGEETVQNKGELTTIRGYGYENTFTGKQVFNYIGQAKSTESSNYIDPADNMLSFFGRANYDYRGRYYLTATMRADASSRFESGNQWGYFPSAALAWRVSDESWMKGVARAISLSNLKLRFSYGTAGNNKVDLGYLRPEYITSPSTYIEGFGNYLSIGGTDKIAPNPELKWETTVTRDLGLDYGFFNDRISGTFDLYWNNTKDLILLYQLSSGYNYQFRNIGSTENKGLEFSIKGVILDKQSKKLHYNLTADANISANRSKVTDLGGMGNYPATTSCFNSDNITTSEFLVEEGEPIGNIYGFESDGWYKASDFKAWRYNANGKDTWTLDNTVVATPYAGYSAFPGLIKLKDRNGDGKITNDDKTIIGNTTADFTGGINLSASIGGEAWGDVDLGLNFTYSVGNDVLNLNRMDYTTILTGNDNTSYRNAISDVAYGKRYSLFGPNGEYLPYQFANDPNLNPQGGTNLSGDVYKAIAAELDAANAGASIWSPMMDKYVVTDYCVEDGSYLRLASLTLGYSLPEKWIKKFYLQKARVFFTASNLFVITNYSGFDPEVDTRSSKNPLCPGVDFSAYPKARAFNFGLNLSF